MTPLSSRSRSRASSRRNGYRFPAAKEVTRTRPFSSRLVTPCYRLFFFPLSAEGCAPAFVVFLSYQTSHDTSSLWIARSRLFQLPSCSASPCQGCPTRVYEDLERSRPPFRRPWGGPNSSVGRSSRWNSRGSQLHEYGPVRECPKGNEL